MGLRKARALGERRLTIRSNSELITGQINKSNRALKPELAKYLVAVRSMERYFLGFSIHSFSRTKNKQANQLAKAAAQFDPLPLDVVFQTLKQASVNCAEEPAKFVNAITSEDWRDAIMAYLRGHFIPEDEKEEKRMALQARNYRIVGEELYRGGVSAPLLKCISREEGKQLLEEIHAGMCSSHIATRALVGKAFREGFYCHRL